MKQIPLTQGKFALVDNEDYERVNQYKWHLRHNRRTQYGIRTIWVKGKFKKIFMHNFIMNFSSSKVDHRDCDGLNNQKSNLRFATKSQNNMNQRKRIGCTSRYKGICWRNDCKKWRVQVVLHGKLIYSNHFLSERNAARAYDVVAKKHFGKFARLNFTNQVLKPGPDGQLRML